MIKPIRSKEDYQKALNEIDELFDASPGSPEFDRLELLSILVEDYEEKEYKFPLPDPIEAIMYQMEKMGLTRKDLEPYIGSRARVSEILNRRRSLTINMIRELENGLGIPAEVLIHSYDLDTETRSPEAVEGQSATNHMTLASYASTRMFPLHMGSSDISTRVGGKLDVVVCYGDLSTRTERSGSQMMPVDSFASYDAKERDSGRLICEFPHDWRKLDSDWAHDIDFDKSSRTSTLVEVSQ